MKGVSETDGISPEALVGLAGYFDWAEGGQLPCEEATDGVRERPEVERISLPLPREDLAELERRAARAGVGYATLIRRILRQHLIDPPTH